MFKEDIKLTIQWYKDHMYWMAECTGGDYQQYYRTCMGIENNLFLHSLIIANQHYF